MKVQVRDWNATEIRLSNLIWASEPMRIFEDDWLVAVHTSSSGLRRMVYCFRISAPRAFVAAEPNATIKRVLYAANEAEILAHMCPVYAEEVGYDDFELTFHNGMRIGRTWSVVLHYADGRSELHECMFDDCGIRAMDTVRAIQDHERALFAMRARAWRASG